MFSTYYLKNHKLYKFSQKKNAPLAVSMYDIYAKDFFKTEDGGAESELPTDESEYGFQKRYTFQHVLLNYFMFLTLAK